MNLPWHRTFLFVNYTWARMRNEADGPFSLPANNFDLTAEWGPSMMDIPHRMAGMFNMDLWKGFKLATSFNASSGSPYNITTGRDDNRDTVSNDRPDGVRRNAARGAARWDASARLSWAFGFGQRKGAVAGRPDDGDAPRRRRPANRRWAASRRRRRGQTVAVRAVRGRHEHLQQHEPARLQRRDELAVLRPADVGGAPRGGSSWGRGSGSKSQQLPAPRSTVVESRVCGVWSLNRASSRAMTRETDRPHEIRKRQRG